MYGVVWCEAHARKFTCIRGLSCADVFVVMKLVAVFLYRRCGGNTCERNAKPDSFAIGVSEMCLLLVVVRDWCHWTRGIKTMPHGGRRYHVWRSRRVHRGWDSLDNLDVGRRARAECLSVKAKGSRHRARMDKSVVTGSDVCSRTYRSSPLGICNQMGCQLSACTANTSLMRTVAPFAFRRTFSCVWPANFRFLSPMGGSPVTCHMARSRVRRVDSLAG